MGARCTMCFLFFKQSDQKENTEALLSNSCDSSDIPKITPDKFNKLLSNPSIVIQNEGEIIATERIQKYSKENFRIMKVC